MNVTMNAASRIQLMFLSSLEELLKLEVPETEKLRAFLLWASAYSLHRLPGPCSPAQKRNVNEFEAQADEAMLTCTIAVWKESGFRSSFDRAVEGIRAASHISLYRWRFCRTQAFMEDATTVSKLNAIEEALSTLPIELVNLIKDQILTPPETERANQLAEINVLEAYQSSPPPKDLIREWPNGMQFTTRFLWSLRERKFRAAHYRGGQGYLCDHILPCRHTLQQVRRLPEIDHHYGLRPTCPGRVF